MATKTTETEAPVVIMEFHRDQLTFQIVGESPLVPHAMSFKAKSSLIFPSKKKTQAERDTTMKHEPFEEYRDAAYKFRDEDDADTRLYMPGSCFHAAMANAAIDMVGAKKAQVGRLTSIVGDKIPVWGVPQVWSTIVRSSDMARTPDVRTLPILPRWAALVTVSFVSSLIPAASVVNLLGAAGDTQGIGDGRPGKGKLSMGKFRIAGEGDAEFDAIVKLGKRAAQDTALANPAYYDLETEQLLTWFSEEVKTRIAAPANKPKARKNNGEREIAPAHSHLV